MTDLAHVIWAVTVVVVAGAAAKAVVTWFGLQKRRLELGEERRKLVEQLSKRFDDVERLANGIKAEWLNLKLRK